MNNFPAMTEERRQELIAECEADISCARTLVIAAINVNDGETKAKWESQLLRQQVALAALTAKPVAYMYKDRLHSEPRFSSHTRFLNWSQEDINEYEITETKLYTSPPAPVLRVPAGWKLVPSALTAENGAKAALLGEFTIEYNLQCHECFGEGCDDCDGEGRWVKSIPVDWTTIKAIWAKGVEHFQEVPTEASNEQ